MCNPIMFYLDEAVVEEEANGGRSGDGKFTELLRSDERDKVVELWACVGVVFMSERVGVWSLVVSSATCNRRRRAFDA